MNQILSFDEIILTLGLMALSFLFGIILALVWVAYDEQLVINRKCEKKQQQAKLVQTLLIYQANCSSMKEAGRCPGVCSKCAWGINIRGKSNGQNGKRNL